MGQYLTIKCPICGTNIQTKVALEYCPVKGCGAYIGDKLHLAGEGTHIKSMGNESV